MAQPSDLSFVGIGKETVRGTYVPPTAYIGVTKIKPLQPIDYLEIKGFRGSMVEDYGLVPGFKWGGIEIGGPVYADTIGWLLAGILGDMTEGTARTVADATTASNTTITSATIAFTANDINRPVSGTNIPAGATIVAVASPTSATISLAATGTGAALPLTVGAAAQFFHAASVLNSGTGQPTSHSVHDFYVAANRAIAGLQWHELTLKWNVAGLLEFDAKGTGLTSATQSKPTMSQTAVLPTPAWTGVVTIGGTVISKTTQGEVKISRPASVEKAINNTQVPLAVFLGNVRVEAKYKALMDDETELARYLNNTQPSLDFLFSQGSGAALSALQLHSTAFGYDKDPAIMQELGKPVYLEIDGHSIGSASDAGASGGVSPIKATMQNAVAAGVYV